MREGGGGKGRGRKGTERQEAGRGRERTEREEGGEKEKRKRSVKERLRGERQMYPCI